MKHKQLTSEQRDQTGLKNNDLALHKNVFLKLVALLVLLVFPAYGQSDGNYGLGLRPSERALPLPIESPVESSISTASKDHETLPTQDQIKRGEKTVELDAIVCLQRKLDKIA